MLERKPSKSFKQTQSYDSDYKNHLASDDPKLRILQYDLVFVNGLPSHISSKEILMKENYFSRYGKVVKSILNPPYPFKKGINYQVYATYENELDASLAIVALDGLNLGDRPLKVSYGTTKYCSYFLKGRECTNGECFYLHQIQKQRQVQNGESKTVFKQQNDRAIEVVLNNLQKIAERILNSKIQNVQQGFPSLTETIDFLIDNDYIDQHQYEKMFERIKKRKLGTQNVKLDQKKIQNSEQKSEQQLQLTLIDDPPKMIKSNSFSTMASPNKPQAASTQFDDQQKRVYEIDDKSKITQRSYSNVDCGDRTVRSDDQNKKFHQIDFQQKIEQNISQKIIKQILKKKGVRSKFDFVKIDVRNTQVAEQIKKVKNIIQRFLITYQ